VLFIDKIERDLELRGSEAVPGVIGKDCTIAIGVTTTAPDDAPDAGYFPFSATCMRAYDIERSFIVGYGRYAISGDDYPRRWQEIGWDPSTVREGDKVGIMVLDEEPRDMFIFVNSIQVMRMETDLEEDEEVFLLVDLYGSVTQVTLLDPASGTAPGTKRLLGRPPRVPFKPGRLRSCWFISHGIDSEDSATPPESEESEKSSEKPTEE
jgi:hypothetical protein